jgi:hypothetical protein
MQTDMVLNCSGHQQGPGGLANDTDGDVTELDDLPASTIGRLAVDAAIAEQCQVGAATDQDVGTRGQVEGLYLIAELVVTAPPRNHQPSLRRRA